MSTMLIIPEEITNRGTLQHKSWMRDMDRRAVWWRTKLYRNEGNILTTVQVDPEWKANHPLWWARYTFYDDNHRWFFPYDYRFVRRVESEHLYAKDYDKTIVTRYEVYLDILDVSPPGPLERRPNKRKGYWDLLPTAWSSFDDYPPHPDERSTHLHVSRSIW